MEIIIVLILILLIFILINQICLKLYSNISNLVNKKIHFIDFFFIGLFGIEQVIFLISYFYYGNISSLTVGIFSVIVIMTSTYQKLLMDIRLNKITLEHGNLKKDYNSLLNKYLKFKRNKN